MCCRVKKFLFCIPLRWFGLFIGWITLILLILLASVMVYYASTWLIYGRSYESQCFEINFDINKFSLMLTIFRGFRALVCCVDWNIINFNLLHQRVYLWHHEGSIYVLSSNKLSKICFLQRNQVRTDAFLGICMIGIIFPALPLITFVLVAIESKFMTDVLIATLTSAFIIAFYSYILICIYSLYLEIEDHRNQILALDDFTTFKRQEQSVETDSVYKQPLNGSEIQTSQCSKDFIMPMLPTYPDDHKFKPLSYV